MSVRKRTWQSAGKDREAWVVDYVDQHGKRRLRTFRTKRAADDWAVAARHEVQQGIHTAVSDSRTVTEAWELWLQHCEAEGLEFGTLKQRRQHLALHVAPLLGRMKLSELTTPRINAFDAELRKSGRSTSMRRKVLTNIKTMLSFAQGQGLVAQNVARALRIRADDRHESTGPLRAGVDFPSKAELKKFMDSAPEGWRPFLVTAIFTGMRASELRGLPWRDVDLDAGVIHVRQRADAWKRIGPPKSDAGKRDIPLAPIVVNTLKQWKPACPAGELDLVFPNRAGNVQALSNIFKRFWKPLQIKCGTPHYGIHMLRHAAASLFIQHLGWSPKRVQMVMGHSSITMTYDRYGHWFEDGTADREAMAKIEAAVSAA